MKSRTAAMTAAAAALSATALVGAPAGAANGDTVKPTKEQKAAIIKAWSKADGGTAYKGPQKCIKVDLATSNTHLAGVTSNAEKYQKKCASYAFDGAAILYGHKNKWYLLTEGSSIRPSQCKALQHLVGDNAWAELSRYAEGLGCAS